MTEEFRKLEDEVLEKETRHDENVIDKKLGNINEHEVQMHEDKSRLMKDLHKEEIRHDEKVIERKENDAARHEEKIKKNEQKICGCGK